MQKHMVTGLVVGLAGLSSAVFASTTPREWKRPHLDAAHGGVTLERCWQAPAEQTEYRDYLGPANAETKAKAEARINWAWNCGHIARNGFTEKLFYKTLNEDTGDWEALPGYKIKYPTFAHNQPDENYPIWIPNLATCEMPDDVIFLGVCVTGCYDNKQNIDFGEGIMSITEGRDHGMSKLRVLDSVSSFSDIQYQDLEIGYFTESQPSSDVLLTLTTIDGDPLTVTSNHPLVAEDGRIKEAALFEKGDALVRADGTTTEIVGIEEHAFEGKVYNIAPKSDLAAENIVVAQGYLNGSAKYQNKQVKDFERVMTRSVIPADLL